MEVNNRASGWTVVYKHSYIDENGKYHSVGHYRNDFMLNMSDKLREERRENAEKLFEKSKEKAPQFRVVDTLSMEMDMTKGKSVKALFTFSVPLSSS